jgi:hypothetical protein
MMGYGLGGLWMPLIAALVILTIIARVKYIAR